MKLQHQIAIVSGGASGIGRATAERFIAEGAHVAILDQNQSAGLALAKQYPEQLLFHCGDVSQQADWQRLFDAVLDRWGRLNVLVNCAAISGMTADGPEQTPEHADIEQWRRVAAVNFESMVMSTKLALPVMAESHGSIINVSSRAGLLGMPDCVFYSATKAAIISYTEATAMHCAKHSLPIRANSICPGLIKTPMIYGSSDESDPQIQSLIKLVTDHIPMSRQGEADEIAKAMVFLASEDSSYMTGAKLVIDGGMLAADPPSMAY